MQHILQRVDGPCAILTVRVRSSKHCTSGQHLKGLCTPDMVGRHVPQKHLKSDTDNRFFFLLSFFHLLKFSASPFKILDEPLQFFSLHIWFISFWITLFYFE